MPCKKLSLRESKMFAFLIGLAESNYCAPQFYLIIIYIFYRDPIINRERSDFMIKCGDQGILLPNIACISIREHLVPN